MPERRRYSRLARVNELVREVVAEELERIDDEALELVTVTGVGVARDLSRATVWYSALATDAEAGVVAAALVRHRVRLQSAVGRQARMKRTPELAFRPDPAISSGRRVEEILRGMGEGRDDDRQR